MTIEKFQELIERPESNVIDFKQCQYSIIKDFQNIKTAALVKDIISFCNTIRNESAYIIIGVGIKEDNQKILKGLDINIDDSIFQEKLKDKVFPLPVFQYYTIRYMDMNFGIIEIPVKKYSEPISPTVRLKGLEPGKIYMRRGSSNSEATGREIILINGWLSNLSDTHNEQSLVDDASNIILNLTSGNKLLSESIAQAFHFANKYNLAGLKKFTNGELKGWFSLKAEQISEELLYRHVKVIFSPQKIEINPYYYFQYNSNQMLNEIKKVEGSFEDMFVFLYPITAIEDFLKNLQVKENTIMTLEVKGYRATNRNQEVHLMLYANKDIIENLYGKIRQKCIDLLIDISNKLVCHYPESPDSYSITAEPNHNSVL